MILLKWHFIDFFMQYLINAPDSWKNKKISIKNENVYSKILSNYDETDVVFEFIKKQSLPYSIVYEILGVA